MPEQSSPGSGCDEEKFRAAPLPQTELYCYTVTKHFRFIPSSGFKQCKNVTLWNLKSKQQQQQQAQLREKQRVHPLTPPCHFRSAHYCDFNVMLSGSGLHHRPAAAPLMSWNKISCNIQRAKPKGVRVRSKAEREETTQTQNIPIHGPAEQEETRRNSSVDMRRTKRCRTRGGLWVQSSRTVSLLYSTKAPLPAPDTELSTNNTGMLTTKWPPPPPPLQADTPFFLHGCLEVCVLAEINNRHYNALIIKNLLIIIIGVCDARINHFMRKCVRGNYRTHILIALMNRMNHFNEPAPQGKQ